MIFGGEELAGHWQATAQGDDVMKEGEGSPGSKGGGTEETGWYRLREGRVDGAGVSEEWQK